MKFVGPQENIASSVSMSSSQRHLLGGLRKTPDGRQVECARAPLANTSRGQRPHSFTFIAAGIVVFWSSSPLATAQNNDGSLAYSSSWVSTPEGSSEAQWLYAIGAELEIAMRFGAMQSKTDDNAKRQVDGWRQDVETTRADKHGAFYVSHAKAVNRLSALAENVGKQDRELVKIETEMFETLEQIKKKREEYRQHRPEMIKKRKQMLDRHLDLFPSTYSNHREFAVVGSVLDCPNNYEANADQHDEKQRYHSNKLIRDWAGVRFWQTVTNFYRETNSETTVFMETLFKDRSATVLGLAEPNRRSLTTGPKGGFRIYIRPVAYVPRLSKELGPLFASADQPRPEKALSFGAKEVTDALELNKPPPGCEIVPFLMFGKGHYENPCETSTAARKDDSVPKLPKRICSDKRFKSAISESNVGIAKMVESVKSLERQTTGGISKSSGSLEKMWKTQVENALSELAEAEKAYGDELAKRQSIPNEVGDRPTGAVLAAGCHDPTSLRQKFRCLKTRYEQLCNGRRKAEEERQAVLREESNKLKTRSMVVVEKIDQVIKPHAMPSVISERLTSARSQVGAEHVAWYEELRGRSVVKKGEVSKSEQFKAKSQVDSRTPNRLQQFRIILFDTRESGDDVSIELEIAFQFELQNDPNVLFSFDRPEGKVSLTTTDKETIVDYDDGRTFIVKHADEPGTIGFTDAEHLLAELNGNADASGISWEFPKALDLTALAYLCSEFQPREAHDKKHAYCACTWTRETPANDDPPWGAGKGLRVLKPFARKVAAQAVTEGCGVVFKKVSAHASAKTLDSKCKAPFDEPGFQKYESAVEF